METALWVGPEPGPDGSLSLLRHACCGSCYQDNYECIQPGLAAVVLAAARNLCFHVDDWRQPCAPCALLLLHLVEMIRNSATWELHEGHQDAEVEWIEALLRAVDVPLVEGLGARYDGAQWPLDYLTFELSLCVMTPHEAYRAARLAQEQGLPNGDVIPREPGSRPPRAGASRAEIEIAARMGWQQPQRWELEERVRAAAVRALNEAHFVELCKSSGVELIPRIGAPHPGVAGYSAFLADLPAEQRREYAGGSLAKDLTLPALRNAWNQADASGRQAWATWLELCPDVAALPQVLEERSDGRWRWILEPVAQAASPELPVLPANPTCPQVRAYLCARQGSVCAMCQIQRHSWEATRGTLVPAELLGPPDHVDHDHATGQVRGLLCVACNTIREPAGSRSNNDVWRAYTQNPPIGIHSVMYPPREG